MMNPSALRAIMRRYGNAGVLVVGIYLGLRHLWHRCRTATVIVACSLLSAALLVFSRLAPSTRPESVIHEPDHSWQVNKFVRPVESPIIPHGRPLFSRAKKLFH